MKFMFLMHLNFTMNNNVTLASFQYSFKPDAIQKKRIIFRSIHKHTPSMYITGSDRRECVSEFKGHCQVSYNVEVFFFGFVIASNGSLSDRFQFEDGRYSIYIMIWHFRMPLILFAVCIQFVSAFYQIFSTFQNLLLPFHFLPFLYPYFPSSCSFETFFICKYKYWHQWIWRFVT